MTAHVTEALVDFGKLDLRAKYVDFNKRFFDGDLPAPGKISLRFSRQLKKATGTCKAKLRMLGNRTRREIALLKLTQMTLGVDYELSGLTITMATRVRYDESEFDAYLIHEMIHAWFMLTGRPFESHGTHFTAKAREIGRKAGFPIPLTHQLKGTEEIGLQVRPKKIGVVYAEGTPSDHPRAVLFHAQYAPQWAATLPWLSKAIRRDLKVVTVTTKAYAVATLRRAPSRRGVQLQSVTGLLKAELDLTDATLIAEVEYEGR